MIDPISDRDGTNEKKPFRSRWIGAEPEEVFDLIGDRENLPQWWGGESGSPSGEEIHFDSDPPGLSVHLRWGSEGQWRHMVTRVEAERNGSRVTIRFVPVPGCEGVCLEREILRAGGALRRIRRVLEGRHHLVDSHGYWL